MTSNKTTKEKADLTPRELVYSGKMFYCTSFECTLKWCNISMKFLILHSYNYDLYWQVFARVSNEWKTYLELEYYKPKTIFSKSIYDSKVIVNFEKGKNLVFTDCIEV